MSEILSTRQVAQRIRHGKLPEISLGTVRCACHPNMPQRGETQALKFWSRGDRIGCAESHEWAPAMPFFPALDLFIDTRL